MTDINKNETILQVHANYTLKEFVSDVVNVTNKCVKILFKICNITKKYTFLFLKDINNEIIKDIIKND
tara:strand:- start:872 stop:1075 length:204 start_codon:yes stop_codon:yes gene_type:complete